MPIAAAESSDDEVALLSAPKRQLSEPAHVHTRTVNASSAGQDRP